ncbi:cell envelope-related transcriptional attenuator [Thermaerobacter marianensis DSM 12885]|uniref:Cell envelope-related transcriptional attenuator n=1 Tax=Thermaerobacter marianensis (strain ATCC 700841 / DSM 12885 / JCM 10246 / 7p75a) TaxID=644966 RepID=E6SI75_THEM7|nr:LCP family protein [Thermaerobacter marianensis]ADU50853.1 cell envelope-related transcriptional attenuator [Thermaerobacter marianensis DSM 12885]
MVRSGRPRRRRILRTLAWLAGLGALAAGLAVAYFAGYELTAPEQPVAPAPEPVSGGAPVPAAPVRPERVNILLLGIDARQEGAQTRSDTMILVSIDPSTRDVAMFSIPRDSRVQIPGHGLDKITHAHAFGGVELATRTVAENFGIPVHHWARIDMPGFLKLIDVLGPVEVDVPYDLRLDDGRFLEKGRHTMDSQLALAYLRERYNDPDGDFGRASRQQQFLIDVAKQLKAGMTLLDLPQTLAIINRYVETDMGLRDAVALARLAWGTNLDGIKRGMVKGRGIMLNGIYYYEVDWPATNQVLADLGIKDGPATGGTNAAAATTKQP